ncbi:hypothetical protein D3273_22900 [Lichenibacterium minor]|uniref:Uncharacterized protein n=1 Tax=Lichenibacterium minor TaxID=2316528 RepID=A0A4Q2TZT5_9HYPH|nr:hypothetical protein [Lichenibacterium minor]RYC29663.1 hypothetical protein D3273_22900 [Lichenibacterium minor]
MWVVNVKHADGTTTRKPCAGDECDAYRYAAWLAGKGDGLSFSCEHDGIVSEELSRGDMIAWAYARCSYVTPLE